jgi:hypothetical protein
VTFRNKLLFYGEELLAPRPTRKLEFIEDIGEKAKRKETTRNQDVGG